MRDTRLPCLVACLMSVGLLASCQPAQTDARATPSSQSACPKPPESEIHFDNGNTAIYWGGGPFCFGKEIAVGDGIKHPWGCNRKFPRELLVRGHPIDNDDRVTCGCWPP